MSRRSNQNTSQGQTFSFLLLFLLNISEAKVDVQVRSAHDSS